VFDAGDAAATASAPMSDVAVSTQHCSCDDD